MRADRLFFALLLLLPAMLAGRLSHAGAQPPAAVITEVEQALRDGGSDPRPARRLLRPVQIGTDTQAWRADFEKAGSADWCGSGGCRVMLLTNEGNGCNIVFDRQVRTLSLNRQRTQLTAEIYGRFCGKAGNALCMARYRWDAMKRQWSPQDDAPPAVEE